MNSYELNKIAGAVLGSLLLLLAVNEIGNILVRPHMLERSVLDIDTGAPEATADSEDTAAADAPSLAALLASADADKGAKVARKCTACHSFDAGGPNKVGPPLYGILGQAKASGADYGYSSALKELGGEWTYEDLDAFLANPKGFASGTKMSFAGLKKPQDRADLVAYLRQQHDAPPELPSE